MKVNLYVGLYIHTYSISSAHVTSCHMSLPVVHGGVWYMYDV